ncbi:hypothetical protein BC938DRAFT_475588 [Jimgerdemannia flammicorona]|uniref:Uncharacterized protein n=1 Tax=Jimgerdemannia flammicorona TaxID=994334 RepID=A0A433PRY1_9FUNG|nr:hypothetical protein BC938DRAFT_475588 [Jimgerdemannia flammicorona]
MCFACDILKDNPEMFLISLGLMVAFIIFSSIWLVIFSRLWLLGNVKSNDGTLFLALFYIVIAFGMFCRCWDCLLMCLPKKTPSVLRVV